MRTILIDDEPLARMVLKEMLQQFPNIEIVAECNDGFEGLKSIQELRPDLIFLDIQMPKITGFEMLELIETPPQVIFTTAFDEYAIKAFEVNALDYLLKPIAQHRLEKAIERVELSNEPVPMDHPLISLPEQSQRVVVKHQGAIKIIPIDQIYYIEAADDYVKIHTENKYYLKHQTMINFERLLPPHQFVRVHRSFIANVHHVNKLENFDKEQHLLIMRNQSRLNVSRNGYAKLKKVLGI